MAAAGCVLVACDDGGSNNDIDEDADIDVTEDVAGDSESDAEVGTVDPNAFGAPGPITGPDGAGSFVFGASTAATQIEDQNPNVDWYWWTLPVDEGGAGNGEFVGDATRGFSMAIDDVELMSDLGLDTYRFSVEWARIEPQRDAVDSAGLDHYSDFIDALIAAGIEPMITLHHFSNPLWVDNFIDGNCEAGVVDTDLCGWGDENGAAEVIDELVEHATLLAETYGDRVDNWGTFNEPVNYLLASYGIGLFPPGRSYYLEDFDRFIDVFRNLLEAHARMYDAIVAADTIDADGDGLAANVGMTLSVVEWAPARNNMPSELPEDIEATERVRYVYHYLMPDSILGGGFDSDLDQVPDEEHPDWEGRLDWLGVQYYFRAGVTGAFQIFPGLDAAVCFGDFDFGACLDAEDPTHWVPSMGYEYYEPGLFNILVDYAGRYPDVPLSVTEAGIAAKNGTRRAENIVRSLEQIANARNEGVDVRGYYHWSLIDNFEWAEGYEPRFGLYRVDYDNDYARAPTEGATVYGEVIGQRRLTDEIIDQYGGLGPMSEESEE